MFYAEFLKYYYLIRARSSVKAYYQAEELWDNLLQDQFSVQHSHPNILLFMKSKQKAKLGESCNNMFQINGQFPREIYVICCFYIIQKGIK